MYLLHKFSHRRKAPLVWRTCHRYGLAMFAGLSMLACASFSLPQGKSVTTPAQQTLRTDRDTEPKKVASDGEEARIGSLPIGDQQDKQMVENFARLLQLASDLKAEVDKTSLDRLSLTITRKADEVEKLAGSMKKQIQDMGSSPKGRSLPTR